MKKIILFIVLLFNWGRVSGLAENKTIPTNSETVPLKNTNPILADTHTTFQILWSSINSGAELNMSSTNYKMKATSGQLTIGQSESENFKVGAGVWYEVPSGPLCTAKPGDANADSKVNLQDIIFKVNYLFKGGTKPNPICGGDDNADTKVNLQDLIYEVNYLFKGGAAPLKSDVCCL